MKYTEQTEGPWERSGGVIGKYSEDDYAWKLIATCKSSERDACLITAAPAMLDALIAIKAFALPSATHIHQLCDDAIAKATTVQS